MVELLLLLLLSTENMGGEITEFCAAIRDFTVETSFIGKEKLWLGILRSEAGKGSKMYKFT